MRMKSTLAALAMFAVMPAFATSANAGFTPLQWGGVVCTDMRALFNYEVLSRNQPDLGAPKAVRLVSLAKSWCIVGNIKRTRPHQDTGMSMFGVADENVNFLTYKTERGHTMFFARHTL